MEAFVNVCWGFELGKPTPVWKSGDWIVFKLTEKEDGLVCRSSIKDDGMTYNWFLSKIHVFGYDWLPKQTCDCAAATTVDAAAGIVEETWVGIVASVIGGFDGLDCESLLRALCTIYGSFFFLFLKNIHNKNLKVLNGTNKLLRKNTFSCLFLKQKTQTVPPGVPICLPRFLANKRCFPKRLACEINQ